MALFGLLKTSKRRAKHTEDASDTVALAVEARCLSRNPRGGQCLRDRRHTGPHQSYKGTF